MMSISATADNKQPDATKEEGFYLYCFAQANSLECLKTMENDGFSFFVVPFQNLLAVLKKVPLEEFCGSDAERNMQEIAWLVPRVQQHESVIEQSMLYSPVFPIPFGTLFSSIDIFMVFFENNYEVIFNFLQKIDLTEEWSVKGLFDKEMMKNHLLQSKINENADYLNSLKKGMRYFQERKMEKEVDMVLFDYLREILNCEFKELSQNAVNVVERKLIQGSCNNGFKIASNWAFLVSQSQSDSFKLKIQSINAAIMGKGLHFELSGPWPAYSFCPLLSRNQLTPVELL